MLDQGNSESVEKRRTAFQEDLKFAERRTVDTRSGVSSYAEAFNLSDEELIKLMRQRTTLDLGSGPGLLGAQLALLGLRENNPNLFPVDSLNIRFASPNYREGDLVSELESLAIDPNPSEIEQAIRIAKRHRLSYSWHDLSDIPSNKYDNILSLWGFPCYSDFGHIFFPKKNEDDEIASNKLKFGSESKVVFKQLIRLLKPSGIMLLHNGFNIIQWNQDVGMHEEFARFFAQQGVQAQVLVARQLGSHPGSFTKIIKSL